MNMNQQSGPQGGKQIQIKASNEKLKGEYSNAVQIMHTKEEIVLDFLNVFLPTGTLNSRVILSPGHFKRMIRVMQDNLEKYENSFGAIEEFEAPEGVGFRAE